MGGYQTAQPLLGKERIWPPLTGVIQAEPFASFHSLFESRQHGNGPDGRFNPCPEGADFFDLLSSSGIPGGH